MLHKRSVFDFLLCRNANNIINNKINGNNDDNDDQRPAKKRARQTVHFDSRRNECIVVAALVEDSDKERLWYSPQEHRHFKKMFADDVREQKLQALLLPSPPRQNDDGGDDGDDVDDIARRSWARRLFRIFRALEKAQTVEQAQQILSNSCDKNNKKNNIHHIQLQDHVVGLSHVVITPVGHAFDERRQRIMTYLQYQHLVNADVLAEVIQEESRVPRMYAQLLGHATVRAPTVK